MTAEPNQHGGFERRLYKQSEPFDKTAHCLCGEKLGVLEGLDDEGEYVYTIVCPEEEGGVIDNHLTEEELWEIKNTIGNSVAPAGYVWQCMCCGKKSRSKYGIDDAISYGWDESCMMNAWLVEDDINGN